MEHYLIWWSTLNVLETAKRVEGRYFFLSFSCAKIFKEKHRNRHWVLSYSLFTMRPVTSHFISVIRFERYYWISKKLCSLSLVPNVLPFRFCRLAGPLWQGSVTSQSPRTRSFSCAWSSPPQFNRSARYLAQQHMCSQPLGNIQTHTSFLGFFFHWTHTGPRA